jgi:chromosome segregation ATPase
MRAPHISDDEEEERVAPTERYGGPSAAIASKKNNFMNYFNGPPKKSKKVEELQMKIHLLKEENAELTTANAALRNSVAATTTDIALKREEHGNRIKELEDKRNKLTGEKVNLEKLQLELVEKESALVVAEEEFESVSQEVYELRTDIAVLDAQITNLNEEIKQVTLNVENIKRNITFGEDMKANVATMLSSKEQEIQVSNVRIATLTRNINATLAELNAAVAEGAAALQQYYSIENELTDAENKRDDAIAEIDECDGNIRDCEADIAAEDKNIESAIYSIAILEQALLTLYNDLGGLKDYTVKHGWWIFGHDEHVSKQTERDAKNAAINDVKASIAEHKEALKESRQRVRDLKMQKQDLYARRTKAKTLRDVSNRKIGLFQRRIEDNLKRQELTKGNEVRLRTQHREQVAFIDEVEIKKVLLMSDKGSLERRLAELSSKLAADEEHARGIQCELVGMRSKQADLHTKLDGQNVVRDAKELQSRQLDKEVSDLKAKKQAGERDIIRLQTRIEVLNQEIGVLNVGIEKLNESVTQKEKQIDVNLKNIYYIDRHIEELNEKVTNIEIYKLEDDNDEYDERQRI